MKDNLELVIELLTIVAVIAICMLITKLIVNSDMPTWLKVFLLR